MRNWILILIILIVPVMSFYFLEKNSVKVNTSHMAFADSGRPKVIKFSAPMCIDCSKQIRIFKIVKPKYKDKIDFVDVNAQQEDASTRKLIEKYNVLVVPTIVFLDKNNQLIKKQEGLMTEKELDNYLKEMLKNG